MLFFILIIVGVLVLYFLYQRQFKKLKIPCVYLLTGGPKTGKTLLTVKLGVRQYNRNLFKYRVLKYVLAPVYNNTIRHLLGSKKIILNYAPMLYSNIPLANVKYNDLTIDIIKRNVRIPNKSVVIIDEASLIADSMSFKNEITNEQVSLFVKLFGHYSHGGSLYYNTQDMKDTHYGFKRCTSSMLWIHSRRKYPFFSVFQVRELISMNDDTVQTMNNFNDDVEFSCLKLVIPNKYQYYYDCFAFSYLTDDKRMLVDYKAKKKKQTKIKKVNLKANYITSFKEFKTFKNERKES